jgi:3-hydroxyacyl-[acyl-carrier-protein] dehydratase
MMNIEEILKVLKHRFPFLLIDRVLELEDGKRVTAIKNVTINDWFFQGHFPDLPIMPGTLITEAMAQTAIMLYHSAYKDELQKKADYFLGQVKVRFLNPVVPGDQLKITAVTDKLTPTGAFVSAKAFIGDKPVAEAELIFAIKR